MDRLTQLDKIEEECTKWLRENPKAPYPNIIAVYQERLIAMRAKTEIFKQQLINLKRENGKTS